MYVYRNVLPNKLISSVETNLLLFMVLWQTAYLWNKNLNLMQTSRDSLCTSVLIYPRSQIVFGKELHNLIMLSSLKTKKFISLEIFWNLKCLWMLKSGQQFVGQKKETYFYFEHLVDMIPNKWSPVVGLSLHVAFCKCIIQGFDTRTSSQFFVWVVFEYHCDALFLFCKN